jgi:CubicO group peptidase (beta-lactamase class C family)
MAGSAPASRAVDAMIEETLNHWRVPGAAVAVTRAGRVLYRRCFGVKRLGRRTPIGRRTPFDIGSVSKTFNAAAVALLVDEGKLSFDDRAVDRLPEFRLYDPWVTEQATLRDLLAHRIGHGEDAITNYSSRFTREQLIRQMAILPPRVPFRSECAYQGYGPIAAGAVVERVSGLSWEDFVVRRIVRPLGLGATWPNYQTLPRPQRSSSPHADFGRGPVPIPHRDFRNMAGAGSVVASLDDLTTWTDIFANRGMSRGKRFLKPETVDDMLTPHSLVHPRGISPSRWHSRFASAQVAYGLGWYVIDYAGHKVVEHTGALEGYIALIAAVPAERLGIVILTNLHQTPAPLALRYALLSEFLGLPHRDWIGLTEALVVRAPKSRRSTTAHPYYYRPTDRVRGTSPSLPITVYAGRYEHPHYGTIPVTCSGRSLSADIVGNPCRLTHWHRDEFRAVPNDRGVALYHPEIFLRFETDGTGAFNRLNIPTLGTFVRRPSRRR